MGKDTKQDASARTASSQSTVNTVRHSLRQQVAAAPAQSQANIAEPLRAQPPRQAVSAAASQMRQRLQSAAPKASSLSDVKSMLNTAFNRDM